MELRFNPSGFSNGDALIEALGHLPPATKEVHLRQVELDLPLALPQDVRLANQKNGILAKKIVVLICDKDKDEYFWRLLRVNIVMLPLKTVVEQSCTEDI